MSKLNEIDNKIEGLYSFTEASEKWGVSSSTLRMAVKSKKLEEGIDCKKIGKQWVVTEEAMEREYGADAIK